MQVVQHSTKPDQTLKLCLMIPIYVWAWIEYASDTAGVDL